MTGKRRDPLTEAMLADEWKVTSIPHPNPRVVRIKVERVPNTSFLITPRNLNEMQQQQEAYYQNLFGGRDHVHVEAGGPP